MHDPSGTNPDLIQENACLKKRIQELEKAESDPKPAEKTLQASKIQLTDIIEFLPDATLAIDQEGCVIIWNKAIEKMTGVPAAEMIGKGDYAYTIPFYGESRQQLMDLIFEDRDEIVARYPHITREGDTLMAEVFCNALYNRKGAWVFAKASPLHDPFGNIIGAIESIRDITVQKQAEEEIIRNDSRLKCLVNILQQGQKTVQEFLDYALAEAISITGSQFGYIYFYNDERQEFVLNTWSKEVMKECTITEPQTIYRLENTGIWGEAVRQQRPILINDYQTPHPLKKGYPEGHAHLRRFLTVPVMNGGRIVAVVGVANKEQEYGEMDVVQLTLLMDAVWQATERKRAEELLHQSETRFREMFDNAPIGYHELDAEGRVTRVNRTELAMLGYTAEEMLGRRVWEFVHEDEKEISRKAVLAKLAGTLPSGHNIERIYCKKDGTRIPVLIQDLLLRDKDGTITGIRTTVQDITDRKQAEADKEKLEAQNRQLQKSESLGRMACAIAHHFNNTLGVVIGNLEMAMDEMPQGAGPVDSLAEAMRAAEKASEMSGLMLTYLGQSFDKRELLDLSETCRGSLPMLQAIMSGDVALESGLSTPGPAVMANKNEIQQILVNLLTNARESVGDGRGAIHLSVKTVSASDIPTAHRHPMDWQPQDTAYACLEVADAGCGIAGKDIEKLFDPFFSSKFTGRGMGLAVVLGIVKAHGGAVTVESEPGRGSTFRVFFPIS